MILDELIITGGVLSLLLAAGHSAFHVLFGWKNAFEHLSILNRKVLYTIHIFLTVLLAMFGLISFAYTAELSSGRGLAGGLSLAYGLFWIARLAWQLIYFRPSSIPHDRELLLLHYLLIALFVVLSFCYIVPVVQRATA